jgi:hypothetical protein
MFCYRYFPGPEFDVWCDVRGCLGRLLPTSCSPTLPRQQPSEPIQPSHLHDLSALDILAHSFYLRIKQYIYMGRPLFGISEPQSELVAGVVSFRRALILVTKCVHHSSFDFSSPAELYLHSLRPDR